MFNNRIDRPIMSHLARLFDQPIKFIYIYTSSVVSCTIEFSRWLLLLCFRHSIFGYWNRIGEDRRESPVSGDSIEGIECHMKVPK